MLRIRMNFKKTGALAICLGWSVALFAQDIIVRKNGDEIWSIVWEVGIDEVRYKKFDNPYGPTYRLRNSEIAMIKYEDGSRDVFNDVSESYEGRRQETDSQRFYYRDDDERRRPAPVNRRNYYRYDDDYAQQLPVLRYTFGRQIDYYGPGKSPFIAGFLSAIVPGVGQFYNGDVDAGFFFMGCNILCNSIWMSAITTDSYGDVYVDGNRFTIGFVGAIVVNVCSIVNGVKVAKRVNRARNYYFGDNTHFKIQPAIIPEHHPLTGREYAYGMNLSLNF